MQDKEEINISTILEIIYELYKEDIKKGKLRIDIFKDKQSGGKSATQSQTFHQTAFDYK